MKTLQNNFTTPEQSKRLLELGVLADSADCYYYKDGSTIYIDGSLPQYFIKDKTYTELEELYKMKYECCSQRYVLLPCWSVGRLIEIYLTCAVDDICDGCCTETPSLHFIQHDKDKLVSTLIELMSEDVMDFSKLEE